MDGCINEWMHGWLDAGISVSTHSSICAYLCIHSFIHLPLHASSERYIIFLTVTSIGECMNEYMHGWVDA